MAIVLTTTRRSRQSHRRTREELDAMRQEALHRATYGQSLLNLPAIYQGFEAMGIPIDQIRPRENVFTFHAWKAKGRHVRKGEHGIRVITWIETGDPKETTDPTTGEIKRVRDKLCTSSTVFHISQTDPDTRALEA